MWPETCGAQLALFSSTEGNCVQDKDIGFLSTFENVTARKSKKMATAATNEGISEAVRLLNTC